MNLLIQFVFVLMNIQELKNASPKSTKNQGYVNEQSNLNKSTNYLLPII